MKDNETRRVVMGRHSRIAKSKGTRCASSPRCGSTSRAQDIRKKIGYTQTDRPRYCGVRPSTCKVGSVN